MNERVYAEFLNTRNPDKYVDLWKGRKYITPLTSHEARALARQLEVAADRADDALRIAAQVARVMNNPADDGGS